MPNRRAALVSFTILVGALGVVRAQYRTDGDWESKAGGKMSFEVASVKPDKGPFRSPGFALDNGDAYTANGGRFSADFALPTYISFAYKVSMNDRQRQTVLARLPKWVTEDRWDIQAKAVDSNPTKDQIRVMMQDLLAERFKLAVHFESQETSVFALVQIKPGSLGPNLRPHSEGPSCDAASPPTVFPSRCYLMAMALNGPTKGGSRNTTIPLIADALPSMANLDRPVVDRTGLSGRFDFTLEWSREADGISLKPDQAVPTDPQGPSFQQALREQLGLKLESTKASLNILVIDHVERPSEN